MSLEDAHSRGSFHLAKAISRCVRASAAKTASAKLKKLLPERMLDSPLRGVRLRLVSFSKLTRPGLGVVAHRMRSGTECFRVLSSRQGYVFTRDHTSQAAVAPLPSLLIKDEEALERISRR